MVYRRGPESMSASLAEREWAQTQGVSLRFGMKPVEIVAGAGGGHAAAVRFARVDGEETVAADMVLKAIGQRLEAAVLGAAGLELQGGRVVADADGRTAVPGLFVGGDCRLGGRDLTVEAVEDGKRAAAAIHAGLAAKPVTGTAASRLPARA
jgi:glutamate synthase (NADPH/NADH) small chain